MCGWVSLSVLQNCQPLILQRLDYGRAFDCVNHNKLWNILKEIGIPDHLTCLLKNLYAGQEATVRTRHGTRTGSKLGKEYIKAIYCHSAYLTYMQSEKRKLITQLCLNFCDAMNCSLPGFSVYGILQARVWEWVAISFFRRFS